MSTADKYEDLVRRSGLVETRELDPVVDELVRESGKSPVDGRALARKLIEARLITPWQNEKLMQGRHKGFFLGAYKLLSHLSKGGMSEVYLAENKSRQKIAIKIFPPNLIEQSSYLARFQQEARTQAALDHPNIVRALDSGCEGKIYYFVMEYVDGIDLSRFVEMKGTMEFRQAADFIRQAADALEYAHSKGMVHRDIKPANLMLERAGKIKLLDLGLARVVDEEIGSLTIKHNENSLGTADYVAPEQAVDSHNVDERADIYSLGGTLYYLLVGKPPFPEGTPVQRMMMHMNQEPAAISTVRPDVPPDLVTIVKKMMAKRPEDRYQTAAAVRDALTAWLDGEPLPAEEPAAESRSASPSRGKTAPAAASVAAASAAANATGTKPTGTERVVRQDTKVANNKGSGTKLPPSRPVQPATKPASIQAAETHISEETVAGDTIRRPLSRQPGDSKAGGSKTSDSKTLRKPQSASKSDALLVDPPPVDSSVSIGFDPEDGHERPAVATAPPLIRVEEEDFGRRSPSRSGVAAAKSAGPTPLSLVIELVYAVILGTSAAFLAGAMATSLPPLVTGLALGLAIGGLRIVAVAIAKK